MSTITHEAVRQPAMDRAVAMRLARTEYQRFAEALRELQPTDWRLATDCSAWDVRAVASHVLGMAEMAASVREGARQRKAATNAGGAFIDELTALQVRKLSAVSGEEITTRSPVSPQRRLGGVVSHLRSSGAGGCRCFRMSTASPRPGRSATSST